MWELTLLDIILVILAVPILILALFSLICLLINIGNCDYIYRDHLD